MGNSRDDWHLIETAPLDGTVVLGKCFDGVERLIAFRDGRWHAPEFGSWSMLAGALDPLGWRPAPPSEPVILSRPAVSDAEFRAGVRSHSCDDGDFKTLVRPVAIEDWDDSGPGGHSRPDSDPCRWCSMTADERVRFRAVRCCDAVALHLTVRFVPEGWLETERSVGARRRELVLLGLHTEAKVAQKAAVEIAQADLRRAAQARKDWTEAVFTPFGYLLTEAHDGAPAA